MAPDPLDGCDGLRLVRPATGPEALESFIAVDTRRDAEVLVRLLPAHALLRDESLDRLRDQARAVTELAHPNVSAVVDVGRTAAGRVYVATDLSDGRPLREELRRWEESLPVLRVLELMCGALGGLEAAHAHGIIHGALTLDSLCWCPPHEPQEPRPSVRVADFGLGGALREEGVELSTFSDPATAASSGEAPDARADLYALGAVLYEILAGTEARDELRGVARRPGRTRTALKPPSRFSSSQDMGPELDAVVLRSLEADPDERYQTAAAFRAGLERVAALMRQISLPGHFPPPPARQAAGRPSSSDGSASEGERGALPFSKLPDGRVHSAGGGAASKRRTGDLKRAGPEQRTPLALKAALAALLVVAVALVAYLAT